MERMFAVAALGLLVGCSQTAQVDGGSRTDAIEAPDLSPAPTCSDGVKNGDESDVDCGGRCAPCADGRSCNTARDCRSGQCDNNVCTPVPSCTDGVKDGTESDVDCGGSCSPCPIGKQCAKAGDCATGECVSGVCAAAPTFRVL